MIRRGVKLIGFTAAFAAGVISSLVFPKTFIIAVLAVLLIFCCRSN